MKIIVSRSSGPGVPPVGIEAVVTTDRTKGGHPQVHLGFEDGSVIWLHPEDAARIGQVAVDLVLGSLNERRTEQAKRLKARIAAGVTVPHGAAQ